MTDAAAAGATTIHFLGVPVRLHISNLRYVHDLLHELRVVRVGRETGTVEVSAELGELLDAALEGDDEVMDATRGQVEEAMREGLERADLEVELSPGAVDEARRLVEVLERVDGLCRSQQLLTLPAPPEVAALRRWLCEEMERQLWQGEAPRPCPL